VPKQASEKHSSLASMFFVSMLKRISLHGQTMANLLSGGIHPWHALDESKAGHYSQLLLKRCVEDRNHLLSLTEDKYRSGELVE
jgi:hypothetical protein